MCTVIFISPTCVHTHVYCNIHFSYMCTYTMASACIDVHARPIHVNIHMYTHVLCLCTCTYTYMYMHLPCTCTVHIQEYIYMYMHLNMYMSHTCVYTAWPLSRQGFARDLDCMHLHHCLPPAVCLTAAQHKARSLLGFYITAVCTCMYIHACTYMHVQRRSLLGNIPVREIME